MNVQDMDETRFVKQEDAGRSTEHTEDVFVNYQIVKVEKTDGDEIENDGQPMEEDDSLDGDVKYKNEIEVTEIIGKEKQDLEFEIEGDECMTIDDDMSEGFVSGQLDDDKAEESNDSTYTCALCKETLFGWVAAKAHLEVHITESSFNCTECEDQYTADCIQNKHTLISFEIVGKTLAGKYYRYFSVCQLLVKDEQSNTDRQVDENSENEQAELESSERSRNKSTKKEESTKSEQRPEQIVAQNSADMTIGNSFHFEAAFLRENTSNHVAVECPFICTICFQRFMSSSDLQHHSFAHNHVHSYICPNCNLTFTRERQLRYHLKQNEKTGCELHICTFCNQIFKKTDLVKTHMFKHTGIGSFECQQCKKKWRNRSILNRHIQSHNSEKAFVCSVCSKCFSTANSLKVHMNIHTGERTFACSLCSKVYTESRFLRVHMYSHTGGGKFKCSICTKTYYSSSQLKLHMCKHTGERPYVCTICNEAFLVKNSLMRHMYRHNGLKPFSCITCGKAFVLKQDLSEHAKIHAIRSHTCKLCKRGFTTGAYLNRHMKQHKDKEDQFQCEDCGLSFHDISSLKRHRVIHQEKPVDSSLSSIVNNAILRTDGNQASKNQNNCIYQVQENGGSGMESRADAPRQVANFRKNSEPENHGVDKPKITIYTISKSLC